MKSNLANQTDDPKARAKQYKDDKKGWWEGSVATSGRLSVG